MRIDIAHLKESNQFLNDLFANVTSGIFIADGEARIQNFNDAFKALFFKPEDQLINQLCGNAMGCIFHEEEAVDCGETSHCEACVLRRSIIRSFTERVPVYKERLDRDYLIQGRRVAKHFIFTTKYVDYRDQRMVLVIFDDVTEIEDARLKAERALRELEAMVQARLGVLTREAVDLIGHERQIEDLVREIHHRVGNNLQIILSLIKLQMEYAEGGETQLQYQELERRILAIRYLYDHLIQERKVSSIGMKPYLGFLANDILAHGASPGQAIELSVDCDEAFFTIDTALPVGLIVNELLMNALRHGFAGRPGGKLCLSLRQREGQGAYVLQVCDDGKGFTLADKRFGLRIVDSLVTQLGGTLSFDGQAGCRFSLSFTPLA